MPDPFAHRDVMIERYHSDISEDRIEALRAEAKETVKGLFSGKEPMTGWVSYPAQIADDVIEAIKAKADELAGKCELLVVCGIGGSYHGAEAVYEALGGKSHGRPKLIFAGTNLSGNHQSRIIKEINSKSACLCVVSKSGNTVETRISYSILKEAMYNKYGRGAKDRIVIITDETRGFMREEADRNGFTTFCIPNNIGGRYSVMTAAALFPMAVAGIDIREFLTGAAALAEETEWNAGMFDYAAVRVYNEECGKTMELFGFSDPYGRAMGEWIKQLFAESEGKNSRGLFPAALTLSTDLHSIGQYLQEGKKFFIETIIDIEEYDGDLVVPQEAGELLAGKSLNEINRAAVQGTINAHKKVGVPVIEISIDRLDAFCIGQFMQYMMMSAAISAKLMGVDPFTQDGVENYKKELRTILGE